MKRQDLVRKLAEVGATYVREGAEHTIYRSRSGLLISVPRHREVNEITAKKILRDAERLSS
jgi:mRNA interferase HicA